MVDRALLSVADKAGIAGFAQSLHDQDIEILSTGGTAAHIREAGVPVTAVADETGFPELLDGRVKTLHPRIHAAVLSRRTEEDQAELAEHGIDPIDLVAVNLYPFENAAAGDASPEAVREQIDIGGPTLIRAAAKNHPHVAVVVDPSDYDAVAAELAEGGLADETRERLARQAFHHTATYDAAISRHFRSGTGLPGELPLGLRKVQEMRYGENPHQEGAFYQSPLHDGPSVATAEQLHGKELSFNNVNDANAATEFIKEFDRPAVGIFKHTNPCGAAVGDAVAAAFEQALECDPQSAFGGIIALNRACGIDTAEQVTDFFNEIVVAPSYTDEALDELRTKDKLRVLEVEGLDEAEPPDGLAFKHVHGGALAQENDTQRLEQEELETVTVEAPTDGQVADMQFGWQVAKHVKSNAIVFVNDGATVGIGAGQMSRVDAVGLAVDEAGEKADGAVMVSDAFFPFPDSIHTAAEAGIAAVVQPGGSVNDDDVTDAADEHGMAMCFTGRRAFRH